MENSYETHQRGQSIYYFSLYLPSPVSTKILVVKVTKTRRAREKNISGSFLTEVVEISNSGKYVMQNIHFHF